MHLLVFLIYTLTAQVSKLKFVCAVRQISKILYIHSQFELASLNAFFSLWHYISIESNNDFSCTRPETQTIVKEIVLGSVSSTGSFAAWSAGKKKALSLHHHQSISANSYFASLSHQDKTQLGSHYMHYVLFPQENMTNWKMSELLAQRWETACDKDTQP